jgi:glyoxylase-like metal-dependent hydrolase (beta-lactamase superfamily II)
MSNVVAECYFLDVGQGAAQVVDLGDDSAIVIDCGPSYHVLGNLLQRRLKIGRIAALVLSHNHSDHVGGVVGLVRQYRKAIDRIYFLQDQSAQRMESLPYFAFLRSEFESGNIPAPIPLIRHSEHMWLYPQVNPQNTVGLELLFPNVFQNIAAQASGSQNRTCGVLLLRCGSRRVLFPGDAEIDAWRAIHKARANVPLECDVIAIPHHGGQIVRHRRPGEKYDDLHADILPDLEWLYRQAIKTPVAIVSAGTSNIYPDQHPLPPQIEAVGSRGRCRILCTQITSRCSDDLERLRPGVLEPQSLPCQSQPSATLTSSGQSRDVACAGTILVQIGPDDVQVLREQDHTQAIDTKLNTSADHPLCRS